MNWNFKETATWIGDFWIYINELAGFDVQTSYEKERNSNHNLCHMDYIERTLGSTYEEFEDKIWYFIISRYTSVTAYHFTRTDNIQSFQINGLLIADHSAIKEKWTALFQKMGASIEEIERAFVEQQASSLSDGELHLGLNNHEIYGISRAYLHYPGGEYLSGVALALDRETKFYFNKLKAITTPYSIECHIPIRVFHPCNPIGINLLSASITHLFDHDNIIIDEFVFSITQDILPKDIISVQMINLTNFKNPGISRQSHDF